MGLKLIFITFALCASLVNCLPTEEIDAQNFVKESSDKLYEMVGTVAELAFDNTELELAKEIDSSEESESGEEAAGWAILLTVLVKMGLMGELVENITTFSTEAAKFKYGEFQNAELREALQNIRLYPDLYILGEYDDPTDELDTVVTNEDICSFKDKQKCDLSYAEDINEIIEKSDNPEELKYYWEKWRENNKGITKEGLQKLAELFKKAANIYEVTPSTLWFSEWKDGTILDDMTRVMREIQPVYKQFHAFVRILLSKKYGADVVPETGPIPAHLFEKALTEEWDPKGLFSHFFTQEDMTDVKKILKEHHMTPKKMVETADDFYKSLGLKELPSEFWAERVKEIEDVDNDDMECRAAIFDMTPKVYMKYCPEVDFRKFLQVHQWMGRLHYATEKEDLPFAFFDSYELQHAVGEAVVLSTMSSKHMSTLGFTQGTKYEDHDHELDRLFRMGIHTILKLPQYFIHTMVMDDLISGKITIDELNEHYWGFMKELAGVSAPTERHADDIDFPYYFYKNIDDNEQATKFFSEVVGYQIYQALCVKAGQFEHGNSELHKCDFYGHTEVGKLLTEMMHLGSRKPWREVLSTVTGSTHGLIGESITEYYAPITEWLKKQNSEHNVVVGW